MRFAVPLSALAALAFTALVLTALVFTSPGLGGVGTPATLRFVALGPLQVRGAHFGSNETVKVTLEAGAVKRSRTTEASAKGAFTVSFGMLSTKIRCGGSITAVAVGGHGGRVASRLPPMECPTAQATVMSH